MYTCLKNLLLGLCLLSLAGFNAAVLAQESIKLGINYPSTGRYKNEGIAQVQGALMAIEEINAAGGLLGRPLELLTANSASEPERAVKNVQQLANQGAAMLFGGVSSAVAVAAGKEAAKHNLIYFGTLTYANEVTGAEGHRHMFRETYNAHMAAKVLAKYLNESLSDKKLFYVTADYNWGWSVEDSMRELTHTEDALEHRSQLTAYPHPRESDFRSALEAAEKAQADVLVLAQFGDDMALAIQTAYNMGLHNKMTIIVPNLTLAMAKIAGSGVMEGVIGAVPWTWQVPYKYNHSKGKAFVERFVAQYQVYPTSTAATAYGIVYQFKDAVERTQSLETDKLIRTLEGHRYSLLKDQQEWRTFDHQNIQTVYAVKGRVRADVLKSHLHDDYFEILTQMSGSEAAMSQDEWQYERQKAQQPLALE